MKYLLSLYGEESGWDDVSPDEMRALMEPWNKYEQEVFDAGVKLASEALQPSSTATTVKVGEGSDRVVSDGPFAETKEQLGGFYLLECENLDEALEWAKKVPLEPGGSIEVRPIMDFTEFGFVDPAEKAGAEAAS
jgi:hypothetical protein